MNKGVLSIALILVLLAPVAQAMPGGGRFVQRDERRPGLSQQPLDFQREAPAQFQRRDPGSSGDAQRPQRFSPEERRQLRRDIHEAGRDLYPPRR